MKSLLRSSLNRFSERRRSKALFVVLLGAAVLGLAVPWGMGEEKQPKLAMQFLLCAWLMAIYSSVNLCRIARYLATECRQGSGSLRLSFGAIGSFIPEIMLIAVIMWGGLFLAPNVSAWLDEIVDRIPATRNMVDESWLTRNCTIRTNLDTRRAEKQLVILVARTIKDLVKPPQFGSDESYHGDDPAPNFLLRPFVGPVRHIRVVEEYSYQLLLALLIAALLGCAIGAVSVALVGKEERALSALTVFFGVSLLFSPVVLRNQAWMQPLAVEARVFKVPAKDRPNMTISADDSIKCLISTVLPGRSLYNLGTYPFENRLQVGIELGYPLCVGIAGVLGYAFRLRSLSNNIRKIS